LHHSRISALILCAGVVGCWAGVRGFPGLSDTVLDVNFLYNLFALLLALEGIYLRLNLITVPWIMAVAAAMTLSWQPLSVHLMGLGLPLLCFPFAVFFLGTVLIF